MSEGDPTLSPSAGSEAQPPEYVYVASSWRCRWQPAVIEHLQAAEIDHYDFRNPAGKTGFGWQEVMPTFDVDKQVANVHEYLAGLDHPRSIEGFREDFAAMEKADTFVLVLPCGRSAHLELGWAVGAGKRTAILLDPHPVSKEITPELMYKMVDFLTPSLSALMLWLGAPACAHCGRAVYHGQYRVGGRWEPDYDPYDDAIVLRHVDSGYAVCGSLSTYAEVRP